MTWGKYMHRPLGGLGSESLQAKLRRETERELGDDESVLIISPSAFGEAPARVFWDRVSLVGLDGAVLGSIGPFNLDDFVSYLLNLG